MIPAEQEDMDYRATIAALTSWVGRRVRVELGHLSAGFPGMDIAAIVGVTLSRVERVPEEMRSLFGDGVGLLLSGRSEVPSITIVVYEKLFEGGSEYGGQELGVRLGGGIQLSLQRET